ncbi:MAG: hypothetical protein NTY95_15705, partial [Bacteroidia bacterium]|nr:hypothetical protein [Bacteroidia bacterium]
YQELLNGSQTSFSLHLADSGISSSGPIQAGGKGLYLHQVQHRSSDMLSLFPFPYSFKTR